eukprot:13671323-Alexandrium_andersonii.AAC.1
MCIRDSCAYTRRSSAASPNRDRRVRGQRVQPSGHLPLARCRTGLLVQGQLAAAVRVLSATADPT